MRSNGVPRRVPVLASRHFSSRSRLNRAAAAIPRPAMRPSAFRELPDAVRQDLERRHCTIPQPSVNRRENVIRGRFASGANRLGSALFGRRLRLDPS